MARSKYSGTAKDYSENEVDLKAAEARRAFSLMQEVDALAEAAKEATKKHSDMKAELLALLEELEIRTVDVSDGDVTGTATAVKGSTASYDEARLKKRLGASMWNKVSTRVLDEKKLGAYVKSGDIETSVVAESITEKPRKPYVRVTF